MKVKALQTFKDLKENEWREKGDVFEVTQERFDDINSHGERYGLLVAKVEGATKGTGKGTESIKEVEADGTKTIPKKATTTRAKNHAKAQG